MGSEDLQPHAGRRHQPNQAFDIANKHFIPLLEGIYDMADLTDADEIFLTSSSLGVAPVTTFDFRRYAVDGNLTRTISQAFSKLIMRAGASLPS